MLKLKLSKILLGFTVGALSTGGVTMGEAIADAGHDHGASAQTENLERMKDLHRGHEHGHDFEAMEEVSVEDSQRLLGLMADLGLALPPLDSARGRTLFVNTGCVVCHSVNNVGGDIGPSLNAHDMPQSMNAFEFSARMWRGAPAMALLQEDLLGEVITLSGQDLANLVAFAHDENEQKKLTADQIPERLRQLIE
jgi:mono/diheme cytochrome c family protein